jgi:hypothetical protein
MSERFRRPSELLLALELPRAAGEIGVLGPALPLLRRAPRGDGHPVLVLPGFTADDLSTRILRWFLRDRGYFVHGWRLGPNLGPDARITSGLRDRVRAVADRHGRAMSIVGWSLGGIYAREIARAAPAGSVRQVITMGSPFRMRDGSGSNAMALYERVAPARAATFPPRPVQTTSPLPVPTTAIYTRTDGVVDWRSCVADDGATSESVEVPGSHSGLGHNPAALWVVADRLAQPEGEWRPFELGGLARVLFRQVGRRTPVRGRR